MSYQIIVNRLYHDLGRPIVFTQRWLSSSASFEERLEAVRDDLMRTHRGPKGVVNADMIWQQFQLMDEMELVLKTVEGKHLQSLMCRLHDLSQGFGVKMDPASLVEIERLCDAVNETCAQLKSLGKTSMKGQLNG